jgi:hypothetical protein
MRREDEVWKLENLRRSLAMLTPGAPGLSRDDAMLVVGVLMEVMADPPAS